jgi:hypothetical protein
MKVKIDTNKLRSTVINGEVAYFMDDLNVDRKKVEVVSKGGYYVKPVFTTEGVRQKLGSPAQVLKRALKEQIKSLVENYAEGEIARRGLTPEQVKASDRLEHRNAYKALYSEFDRQMRIELGNQGISLEEIGLGIAKNTTGKSYIERISAAGHLENLQIVARELFGKSVNNVG